MLLDHIQLMARYNQWMNEKVYAAAATVPDDQRRADKGAFFKSIEGTLNHLMVGDLIWLKRLSSHPTAFKSLDTLEQTELPHTLDEPLFSAFVDLRKAREALDATTIKWSQELTGADLQYQHSYHNMKGEHFTKAFGSLILHMFNHQTHHRGQVTTLLSQAGVDVGVTDLLVLIPEAR